jgi:arylsulfatase A-like enzyme
VCSSDLPANDHLVEGRSLLPLLRGGKVEAWRDAVFSELDYAFREARLILKRGPRDCRAMMVRTERWKYVWWQDFRPMLFDLVNDPKELHDLGADSAHAPVRREMEERLAAWLKARKTRVTVDDAYVEARTAVHKKHGIFFGVW